MSPTSDPPPSFLSVHRLLTSELHGINPHTIYVHYELIRGLCGEFSTLTNAFNTGLMAIVLSRANISL